MSYLYVDIETVPTDDAAGFLPVASPPSNYKKQDAIDAYIKDANAKALERAALDIDLGRVVSLGFTASAKGQAWSGVAKDENEEKELLEVFWTHVTLGVELVGFNIVSFDLPMLLRRSFALMVRTPHFFLSKYKHPTVIDIMQDLSWNGLTSYRSLDFYCRRYGVPHDDTVSGADVGRLYREQDFDAIASHALADVVSTAVLHERLLAWKALR